MGGLGSGAQRSTHIGNVEEALALDIRVLRRLGVVLVGECICDTVHWSIDSRRTHSARLRVDLSDIERGGIMTVIADMIDGTLSQRIAINAIPSPLGGWRCYFFCPVTARRCEVLYYAGGRFASRDAQRLSYSVQNMTDFSRVQRKAAKLHSRLRGLNGLPRARGRHRIEVAERLREARRKAKELYLDRLRGMAESRSGTRRRPEASR